LLANSQQAITKSFLGNLTPKSFVYPVRNVTNHSAIDGKAGI